MSTTRESRFVQKIIRAKAGWQGARAPKPLMGFIHIYSGSPFRNRRTINSIFISGNTLYERTHDNIVSRELLHAGTRNQSNAEL